MPVREGFPIAAGRLARCVAVLHLTNPWGEGQVGVTSCRRDDKPLERILHTPHISAQGHFRLCDACCNRQLRLLRTTSDSIPCFSPNLVVMRLQ